MMGVCVRVWLLDHIDPDDDDDHAYGTFTTSTDIPYSSNTTVQ